MQDENIDEDRKYVLLMSIRRSLLSENLNAEIEIDPRDNREAIAILNMLSEAQTRVMAFINKENGTNYNLKHFHNGKLVEQE